MPQAITLSGRLRPGNQVATVTVATFGEVRAAILPQ
jgi:hypothetical protein